ncbi:HD-GYP domain-containing protein [Geobacter pickeringii]|uniref:HD-GYP domain-containing protein n=1 Tax=Geobacter pickeringii TaxID=345632 RepID=A0A0B5BGH7_9BACT|nr:HD domain-containing phosphohydrolase [Geobacter pickeringii]AJE03146.1 hypothetical protein GPICK_07020 [Geobacter pickeringii]
MTKRKARDYPVGLKGNDIPRNAQLGAICDVYLALTADRSYQKAVSSSQALKTMQAELKGQFNKELLQRFAAIITGNE